MLPREFRQLLAELEMLSHGSTQSWNKTAPPCDRDSRPHGESFPPHEQFRIDYEIAHNDLERQRIVHEAKELLLSEKGLKPKPVPKPELPQVRNKEILDRGEGWEVAEVARVYRVSVREVMKIRTDAGRDVSTGKVAPKAEPKRDKVVRLYADGMTRSQIALAEGVTRQAVSQMLKRAA